MFIRTIGVIICSILFYFSAHAQKNSKQGHSKSGTASYYHNKFNGRKTATGEIFDNKGYTAASNIFPLGTYVKVTNISNGKKVVVKINDRMAKSNHRAIDLTQRAAKDLCFQSNGVCKVLIEKNDNNNIDTLSIPFSVTDTIETN